MKKWICFFTILIFCFTVSAENIFSTDQEQELQKIHIEKIKQYGHNEVLNGEHYFIIITEGESVEGKLVQSSRLCSVYETKDSFSTYNHTQAKNIYIYNKFQKFADKMVTMDTFHKITVNKPVTVLYKAIVPSLPQGDGFTIHVKTDDYLRSPQITRCVLQNSDEIYTNILRYLEGDPRYIIVVLNKIAEKLSYIIVVREVEQSRGIVTQNFNWAVGAEQVRTYGDGTVINYLLFIKSGTGMMRHELMAGYLVLTGITGSWSGTGILYMQK